MKDWVNKVHCGSALDILKQMPDNFVDMCISSPPYWSLRDYKTEGQIGLEADPKEYLEKIWAIFNEIKRILKKTGSIYVNYGDTYSSDPSGSITGKGAFDNRPSKQAAMEACKIRKLQRKSSDYKSKCMCCIPERFVLGMIDRSWILRNKIIWFKPNSMPSSVKDRFSNRWEYVYFFSRNQKYYFNLDGVRESHKDSSISRYQYSMMGKNNKYKDVSNVSGLPKFFNKFNYRVRDAEKKNKLCPQFKASSKEIKKYKSSNDATGFRTTGIVRNREKGLPDYSKCNARGKLRPPSGEDVHHGSGLGYSEKYDNPLGKNPGDLWKISTKGFSEAHFATFPEDLCIKPILASCPENGIVLDPFSGAGTTCLMAKKLGRQYIGIEINKEYVKMSEKRIHNTAGLL